MSLTPETLRQYARDVQPVHVIDVETTGLQKDCDIIEFGLYSFADDTSWGTLVQPTKYSANATAHVTGITDDDLCDAPTITDALDELHSRVDFDNGILIAHNGFAFDYPRINNAFVANDRGQHLLTNSQCIDTLNLARLVVPWHVTTSHSLDSLIQFFKIEGVQEHRAASDCEFTARILDHLLVMHAHNGATIRDIQHLIDISQHRYKPTAVEKKARALLKSLQSARSSETATPTIVSSLENAYQQVCSRINA